MENLNAGEPTHEQPSKERIIKDVAKLHFNKLKYLPLGCYGNLDKDILSILEEGIISYKNEEYESAINLLMSVLQLNKTHDKAFLYLQKCHKKIFENKNNK